MSLIVPVSLKTFSTWTPLVFRPLLWFDASQETYNNDDSVTVITDKSGNGRNATPPLAANRPLFKTNIKNSQPAFLFDGTNDYASIPHSSALVLDQLTILSVVNIDDFSGNRAILDKGEDTNYTLQQAGTSIRFDYVGTAANVATNTPGWIIAGGTMNVSNNLFCIRNYTKSSSASTSSTPTGTPDIYIGASGGISGGGTAQNFWPSYISEIIMFDRELSPSELVMMQDYLTEKWAL